MTTQQTSVAAPDTLPAGRQRFHPQLCQMLAERDQNLPVWVRPPSKGVEHFSGLSKGKLYELANAGKIKSASLREPGKLRGCRLFLLSSILGYIERNTR